HAEVDQQRLLVQIAEIDVPNIQKHLDSSPHSRTSGPARRCRGTGCGLHVLTGLTISGAVMILSRPGPTCRQAHCSDWRPAGKAHFYIENGVLPLRHCADRASGMTTLSKAAAE